MFHGNCSQTQIGWMWYWHMLHLLQLASLQQHRTITSFRLLKGKNNWHIKMIETVRQYVTVCAILNLHRILISSNILPLRNRSSAWSSDCETVSSGTGRHDLISCPLLSRHWMHLVWGEHPQLKVILQLTSPAPMKKQRNLFRFWIISTDFYPIYIAFSLFAAVSYTAITCSSIFGHKSSGNSGSGSVNPLHFCRVGICIRQLTRSLLPGAIPFDLKGLDNLIQLVDTCRML